MRQLLFGPERFKLRYSYTWEEMFYAGIFFSLVLDTQWDILLYD